MRSDIMTLFPDTVGDVLSESILGRAQERGFITIRTHQIRDYTTNKQNQVDDYPYGGGHGAVMQADPLYRCWAHICEETGSRPHTIFMSPCGVVFDQGHARRLAGEYDHLILVCGHYEGVDQRALDTCVDEEISIGDYILTGGEPAAMVLVDCVSRFIPGVLGSAESPEEESFEGGLLEYPQYTRPRDLDGMEVPEILLNGDHAKIKAWRRREGLKATLRFRPDLLETATLDKNDLKMLEEIRKEMSDKCSSES
jgi:tRNA (guanine37-N1)-methyltransferase